MRCLLIDDDIPTIEALLKIINWDAHGISELDFAFNIQEAKILYAKAVPDLIICDIEMPRGSGIDMIQWVRERQYDGAFLFFTCHESFDYASNAISYDADAYLVKPLDKPKLEAALRKALDTLKQNRKLDEYSKLGLTYMKNKEWVERNFWRDVLTSAISPRADIIESEIRKRYLNLAVHGQYILFLASIPRSQVEERWEGSMFLYALSNLSSEVLFKQVNHDRVIPYQTEYAFYNAIILEASIGKERLAELGEQLILKSSQYLKCVVTNYISETVSIPDLSVAREQLEKFDVSNIIFRGKVHWSQEPLAYNTAEKFEMDTKHFEMLFVQKEQIQIVNALKKLLETLTEQNMLDSATLHSVREDFMQVVYTFLARNHVQAHQLFASEAIQELAQKAESSVIDFMKWAQIVTTRTISFVKEILESEGVVERAKRFIQDNYNEELSTESVAAHVYLTTGYLSKMFKNKTGLSIREYTNQCRIDSAKRMLLENSANIGEIAMETGFESISYFSTVFKKLTGETPISYRNRHK